MGNACAWIPAKYPSPDTVASAADFRLAEAAHALQQVPLDGLLLPVRLTQAQLYIAYSVAQTLCIPSKRGMLLKALTETPDIVLPACCKLYAALKHHETAPIDVSPLASVDAHTAIILESLQEIQQATCGTKLQLDDLKAFLEMQQIAAQILPSPDQAVSVIAPKDSISTQADTVAAQSNVDYQQTDASLQRTPLTTVNLQVHEALGSPHAEKENSAVNVLLTADTTQKAGSQLAQSTQLAGPPETLAEATDNPRNPSVSGVSAAASSVDAPLTYAPTDEVSKQSQLQSPFLKRSNSNTSISSVGSAKAGVHSQAVKFTPCYAASYEEHLHRCQELGLSVLLHPHKKVPQDHGIKGRAKRLVL